MSFNVVYPCQVDISGATTKTTLTTDASIVLSNISNNNIVNSSSMLIQEGANSVLVSVSGVSFSRTSTSLGPTQLYLNDGTSTSVQAGSYRLENANGSTALIPESIQLNDMNGITYISSSQIQQTMGLTSTVINPGSIGFTNNTGSILGITESEININGSKPVSISSNNGIVYTLGGTTTSYTQQGTSFKTGGTQNNYLNSDTLKTTYIVDTSNSSGSIDQLLTQSASGLRWESTIKPSNISDTGNSVGTTNQVLHKSDSGLEWASTIQPSNISDSINSIGTTNQILDKNASGLEWTSTIQPSNISDTGNSVGTTNQILAKSGSALRWTNTIQPTNISDTDNSIGTTDQLLTQTASGIRWTSTIKPTNIYDTGGLLGTNGQYLQKQAAGIVWASPSQFNPVLYGGTYITPPTQIAITGGNVNMYIAQTTISGATGTSYYLVNCNFIINIGGTSNNFYATLGACPGTGVQTAATTTNMCGSGLLSANSIATAAFYGVAFNFTAININKQAFNLSMIWRPNSATGWSAGLWVNISGNTSQIIKYCITVTRITPN
jgi:hypothetical protein